MAINRLHLPDFSVIDDDEGSEIMIVEIQNKFPNNSLREAVIMLRSYMEKFFTKVALMVTPEETLIMRKVYLDLKKESDQGYYSQFIKTKDLFGSDVDELNDKELENFIYLKILELVDSINRDAPIELASKICHNLIFLLENTHVVKRGK